MAGVSTSSAAAADTTPLPSTDTFFNSASTSTSIPIDYQALKAASATIRKNPKKELGMADLLKLLSYLEGELQAREVVIATLKSENVKQFIYASQAKPLGLNDPHAAMFRDNMMTIGNFVSRQSSTAVAQSEQNVRLFARQQLDSLENAVMQQRNTHIKLVSVIKDSEEKHKYLLNELEEEKQKHERDTAQGDDITYGLEVERTRLKQDLEAEKANNKQLEKELKRAQETLETEKTRQKTIVLLLLAERKRIIMKYIEERKRSEDLAQILSEEKQRVDSIAEGLEEESKKSLRMEAELEKQLQSFEVERRQYKASIATDDKKIKEQEQEIIQLKAENDLLRKQNNQRLPLNASGPLLAPKGLGSRPLPADPNEDSAASGPMMSSVTKVVQPTATVSSVPVSGPTTGIARSISPGQTLRQTSSEISTFNTAKVTPRKLSNASAVSASPGAAVVAASTAAAVANPTLSKHMPQLASAAAPLTSSSHLSTIKKNPAALPLGRGVPPPIPPNKPVVPPKREPSATRLGLVNTAVKCENFAISSVGGGCAVTPLLATGAAVATSGQSTTKDDGGGDIAGCSVDDLKDFQQAISSISNK